MVILDNNSSKTKKTRWPDLCAPVFGQGDGFVDTNPYHSSRPGAASPLLY